MFTPDVSSSSVVVIVSLRLFVRLRPCRPPVCSCPNDVPVQTLLMSKHILCVVHFVVVFRCLVRCCLSLLVLLLCLACDVACYADCHHWKADVASLKSSLHFGITTSSSLDACLLCLHCLVCFLALPCPVLPCLALRFGSHPRGHVAAVFDWPLYPRAAILAG